MPDVMQEISPKLPLLTIKPCWVNITSPMFRKGSKEKGKEKRLENLKHIQFPPSRGRVAEVRVSARNNQTAKKRNPS